MSATSRRPETTCIHTAWRPDASHPSVTPDLTLSTVFEHGAGGFGERSLGYSRHANPNRTQLESVLASLESAAACAAFSSGAAAITAVFQALKPGDDVLISDDVYSGTRAIANLIMTQWQLRIRYVQPENMLAEVTPATRLLWLETPSNPMLRIADIKSIATAARARSILTLVDNTWATPLLQQPLLLGADLVVHSATKYLGGHSDILGGAVLAADAEGIFKQIRIIQTFGGAVPSPFDCWLLVRSIKTLPLRLERQVANAQRIASFLEGHPLVEKVFYPGLASHPNFDLAQTQMRGPGAMISFQVKGGRAEALKTVGASKLIIHATSLGGVESTWEQRATSEGPLSQTPQNLIRLSVGAEYAEDLIEDISQALLAGQTYL
jgi:cystathionine gamma-synthase